MAWLRTHIHRHPRLAIFLIAAALLLKIWVPQGYMPGASGGFMVVEICSGAEPRTMVIAFPGKAPEEPRHDAMDMPCAFSGLSAPSLSAADPIVLAFAIIFILATGLRPATGPLTARLVRLRPPAQGPPAIA